MIKQLMRGFSKLIGLALTTIFACGLVLVVGCCQPVTNKIKGMNVMEPEHLRLREILAGLPSSVKSYADENKLERMLARWFRRLPPEDRVEVIRESMRAAVRIYTEYRPDLAWMTNVIEQIHALDENEVDEIFKRPVFEESGPPLGFFGSGIQEGMTAVLWQGINPDKSPISLFASAVVILSSNMHSAAEAFLNPERFRASETYEKLSDEWMKAGQKPEDPLLREMKRLEKVVGRPVDKEVRDWIRQVVEPIIRRIDVEIERAGPSRAQE